MKQMTSADVEYGGKRKQTRKELFLIDYFRLSLSKLKIVPLSRIHR
jgi:hypothetical protein